MAKKKASLLTSKPKAAASKSKTSVLKTKPSSTKPSSTKPSPKPSLLKAKTTRRTDEVKRKALAVAGAEDLKRINLNVPKSFHDKVKGFAITQDTDISGVVVAALNEYMSKRSK